MMRFVVFFLMAAVAAAQDPTPTPTPTPEPVTVTLTQEQIAGDVLVIPFPDHAMTITFALTDPNAPDPITLRFELPSTVTLAAWQSEVQADVAARLDEAEQGVRGMGGDATLDAIKSAYRDRIAEQENIEGMLQHYFSAVIRVRYLLEMLLLAAAQVQNAGN